MSALLGQPRPIAASTTHGDMRSPRVALVHDYLVHVRGGERVFQALCDMYPTADVYTLVHNPAVTARLLGRPVKSTFIQRMPWATRYFRAYFSLYPFAAKQLDLTGYDLVISSSSAWAHWIRVAETATFICYCYTPFRYAWSHYDSLVRPRAGFLEPFARPARALIQNLDRKAAARVDRFVTSSRIVQARILEFYGRDAVVVPPPVDLQRYRPTAEAAQDYYLAVSALMRYKRIDIAVDACTALSLPLVVVGVGEDETQLRGRAGPTVSFIGRRSDEEVAQLYAGCRAFLFPTNEDFGITPLEAMASGRPVIALRAGGVTETVKEYRTGLFFDHPTAESMAEVLRTFDDSRFDQSTIRRHAENYSVERFQKAMRQLLQPKAFPRGRDVAPEAALQ